MSGEVLAQALALYMGPDAAQLKSEEDWTSCEQLCEASISC